MFLEQLKCETLVALRESAVADHVREHDRGEFAMFGAVLRHRQPCVRAYQNGVCKAKDSEATARTTKRFPSSRCASAIQIVRPLGSIS